MATAYERRFHIDRPVIYSNGAPLLSTLVRSFRRAPASEHPEMLDFYKPSDPVALIGLDVKRALSLGEERELKQPGSPRLRVTSC
jgi:hypothetical protein